MGREVRRVPKDWQHPKDERGRYIPLHGGDFSEDDAEWTEARAMWLRGFKRGYGDDRWEKKESRHDGIRFTEWSGGRPNPDDYMPEWPESERTHWQMYETCTEGTPISPVMEPPEALARWLADNNASSFGSMTATYEQWLGMITAGWAPSGVMVGGVMDSGVAFIASQEKKS